MKNLLIAFGLLDLLAFARLYKMIPYIYDVSGQISALNAVYVFSIVALLVTGILSMLRNKYSLYAYYLHFPFKLVAAIFTFGFLTQLFVPQPTTSTFNKVFFGVLLILEFARLAITVIIHKRYFTTKSTLVV